MNAKALEALKGSIAKWEAIVDGSGTDNGQKDCPLCQIFDQEPEDPDEYEPCAGCPVAEETGMDGCSGTPYTSWRNSHPSLNFPYRVDTNEQRACAQAELDFLRSLLPPEGNSQ